MQPQPHFNSFHPQFQNNSNNAPLTQQVFTSNPSLGNSNNLLNNPIPMQPQMGIIHNTHSANMPHLMTQHVYMNNQLSNLGTPQLGFGSQQHRISPVTGQFCSFPQNQVDQQGQFKQYLSNLPQTMGLSNGLFCLQNPMQNMNHFLPLQMPNPTQVVPFGAVPVPQQSMGCLNPAFFVNPQFGLANQVNQNLVPNAMDVNALKPSPIATPNMQGNSSVLQPKQGQNTQGNGTRSQGKPMQNGQANSPNSNWKKFPSKKFNKNPKREAYKQGLQKSQVRDAGNSKRKFGFSNECKGQGPDNERAANSSSANSMNQAGEKKRSLAVAYTEQEIQQWREQRRKNYPSKANTEKKLTGNVTDSEEAKIRCEQLKEILAKQAELGIEVAEVPSYYLSDIGTQGHGREESRMPMTKKERLLNKHDRRGRYNKNDQLAKNQSNARPNNKKKPTLLEKLMIADVRKDKRSLLQVLRFMVMNSFFKEWPEKPLEFPSVVVKESGWEGEVGGEKSILLKNEVSVENMTMTEDIDDDDDVEVVFERHEEGEIID